jgi:hypothetical protein
VGRRRHDHGLSVVSCGLVAQTLTPLPDPDVARRWAQHRGIPVAPKYDEERVMQCLSQALDAQRL